MGSDNFRQVGTFDFTEGIGTSVSGTASSFSCSNQSVSDKGFSKESVVTRRSEHSYSEGCVGGGKSSFSSRVLFPAVLGSQEERENETGSRSFCSQSVSGGPTFQNGDQQVYQVDNSFRNLDNLSRFDGRLFSHPYFSQVSSFPETGLGRQGLQFQGYAFWPGYCTPSFYQDFSDGGVLSSYSGSTHSLLPRRFSHQESLPISFGGTHQFVYPFTPETGFFDFMGKIRDNSQSEFQFPGRTFSDRFGSSASSRREGSQGTSVSQCSDSVFICPSSSIASAGGFLDFDHGRHSTRTSTHSSNPVVSVGVLAPNFSVVGGTCSHSSSVVTSSSMVASGKTSSEGSFVGSSRPQPNFVHRCESDGLGSLSGGQDSIRPLVRCSVGGTHQSSRDESCVSFSPSVSGCDSGSVTTGCHGQLHSSGLSSESRGDPFLFSVSSEQGNSSSVSQSRYNSVSETCSRQSKSSGGCSLPFPCSSEHRMGNSSISVSGDHSSLGSSSYRSFCHQSESQVGDLPLATGRRRSEIHALSISESCLRFAADKSSVTLLTDPSFLAKNQLPDKGSGLITIPALPPTADNQVLCPVRALLVYLASSAKLRSAGSSRLFIPIKKGISDISAKTISTWICNTVILAYKVCFF
ncbi:Hypothetical predicted protein [Mytilus galloprovincialis]|uniref:Uncharacterized protein n=1 Tax=Mytilus galloprovincialis TaxID=29158 RepID=A0A8B6DUG8_MYTGA|nr:Hypothetical predicted protein [Mytilus galloprovincialis]